MKQFKGKSIYTPKPAAAEYGRYVCNFYKGCSCNCGYCCNSRWGWGLIPTLKKCFKDEEHALEVFEKEVKSNIPELQKHGLFFSISTDACLPETFNLTYRGIFLCGTLGIKCTILTKCTDWVIPFLNAHEEQSLFEFHKIFSFGFTLTGHDELEPNASTNAERRKAMRRLHEAGFRTWASIEPIITIGSSKDMIHNTLDFCEFYKIGLESGKRYDKDELLYFMHWCIKVSRGKIYFKDSLLQQAGISRLELPNNCVDRDYNLFKP